MRRFLQGKIYIKLFWSMSLYTVPVKAEFFSAIVASPHFIHINCRVTFQDIPALF